MTDPVSKLQAIGKETVAKLKDLTAAAAASPNSHDSAILQDFCDERNSVCTGVTSDWNAGIECVTVQPNKAATDMLSTIQYITVQCSAVQCSAVQYSTVQYSTVREIAVCSHSKHAVGFTQFTLPFLGISEACGVRQRLFALWPCPFFVTDCHPLTCDCCHACKTVCMHEPACVTLVRLPCGKCHLLKCHAGLNIHSALQIMCDMCVTCSADTALTCMQCKTSRLSCSGVAKI